MGLFSGSTGGNQQGNQIQLDDERVTPFYADLTRATLSRDATVIDFAFFAPTAGEAQSDVKITSRVVMNLYNAKRVLTALELTVQRHEVTFGAIEENESRRRQDQQAVLNAEGVRAVYANFGRVTGTAEELIIDIGLNPEPFSEPPVECKISHRPIMDFYAAKQLAAEISRVVQEHERSEGTIEVDPKLRMKAGKPGRW